MTHESAHFFRTAAIAVAVIVVSTLAPAAASAAPVAKEHPSSTVVDQLPYPVDSSNTAGWWRPLDVVGDTTYFAFNAPASVSSRHEVHLAARDGAGQWIEGCVRTSSEGPCADFADDNGHNQPSIVIDGDGTIHAFVSMHNEQWNYFSSTVAGDVTSLVDTTSAMPDLDVDITYPITARGPDGDAWVLVRTGTDADGAREGVLYHYDLDVGRWERETTIAAAKGYAFYPDDLEVDKSGRVHVLWEWGPFPADPARHLGSYAVYNPRSGTLSDVSGAGIAGPVTPHTDGSVIWRDFVEDESIGSYTPALQTAKLALNGLRLSGIVYRFVEEDATSYDVHYASWTDGSWGSEPLIDTSELGADVATSAGIDVTYSGATTRVYAVITAQVCGELRSQVVEIEKKPGTRAWTYITIGEQRTGEQRLRSETTKNGTDVLYMSAPNANPGVLSYGEIPRSGNKQSSTSLRDIVIALRGELGGTNVALGANVTASSSLRDDTGGELAVDGLCSDASRWISAADDAAPAIEITWRDAAALAEVRVRSGYSKDIGADSVLRSFTIEVNTLEGWVEIASYEGNTDRLVRADTGGRIADGVRVLISDPSASATDVARVFEIEAIVAE